MIYKFCKSFMKSWKATWVSSLFLNYKRFAYFFLMVYTWSMDWLRHCYQQQWYQERKSVAWIVFCWKLHLYLDSTLYLNNKKNCLSRSLNKKIFGQKKLQKSHQDFKQLKILVINTSAAVDIIIDIYKTYLASCWHIYTFSKLCKMLIPSACIIN